LADFVVFSLNFAILTLILGVFRLIFVMLIQAQRFGHIGGNFVQRVYHFGWSFVAN
jgi:hypothetical protein